jgi:hypothetical protein
MPDGRADEGAILPFGTPWEQPVAANKPAATMTAPHRGGRRPHQRTMSIYATLAAVTERFGFCECCRP